MRTGIDLFAGIGGFSLAMQMNDVQVIEQVEIDPYCLRVLKKNFPGVKRHGDITTYHPTVNPWIVTGGFPCQDISSAGRGVGLSGERSILWWQMHRVIEECAPHWVLIENVPALRTRGADDVLGALEGSNYAGWAFVVGADNLGAPHKRKRVFIVAHSNNCGCAGKRLSEKAWQNLLVPTGSGEELGNANCEPSVACSVEGGNTVVEAVEGCKEPSCSGAMGNPDSIALRKQSRRSCWQGGQETLFPALPGCEQFSWEMPRLKSRLGRTIDGIPGRVDKHRIKALGNAIVPQIAALIIKAIIQTEEQTKGQGI